MDRKGRINGARVFVSRRKRQASSRPLEGPKVRLTEVMEDIEYK
jgi:hypothetical protein